MSRVARFLLMTVVVAQMVPAAQASSFDDGVKHFKAKNYAAAVGAFQASEKANVLPDAAMYYEALCYQYQNQTDKAVTLYNSILSRFPSSAAAANARTALSQLSAASKLPLAPAAQQQTPTVKKLPKNAADWYMGLDTVIAEVPFAYQDTRMIVVATIQGKQIPALFDTGANLTMFSQGTLKKYGVDLKNTKPGGWIHGTSGQSSYDLLPSQVKLGDLSVPVNVAVEDTNVVEPGLIGADFFGDYVFEVDPSAQVIRFLKKVATRGAESRGASKFGEPFEWRGDSLVVTPKINGRECPMIFDTGCSGLAFTDKQLGAIGMTRPVDSASGYSSGVGGKRQSFAFTLDNVSLGPAVRKNVEASVGIYGTQSLPLLGMGFLGGMRFIVDPGKQIIRMAPPR